MAKKHRKRILSISLALGCLVWVFAARGELTPGQTITHENWEKVKTETFQGMPLKDLVTDGLALWITKYHLPLTLVETRSNALPEGVLSKQKVKFDPDTRGLTNYQGGIPFPTVKPSYMDGVKINNG